jgi:uncharacterized protein (DUF1810 family)
MNQTPQKQATGKEIREVLGPVDDEIVAAIIRIGASSSEVEQAFKWLNDDDYMGAELQKPINDSVRRVYELLQSERDSYDPSER